MRYKSVSCSFFNREIAAIYPDSALTTYVVSKEYIYKYLLPNIQKSTIHKNLQILKSGIILYTMTNSIGYAYIPETYKFFNLEIADSFINNTMGLRHVIMDDINTLIDNEI